MGPTLSGFRIRQSRSRCDASRAYSLLLPNYTPDLRIHAGAQPSWAGCMATFIADLAHLLCFLLVATMSYLLWHDPLINPAIL